MQRVLSIERYKLIRRNVMPKSPPHFLGHALTLFFRCKGWRLNLLCTFGSQLYYIVRENAD